MEKHSVSKATLGRLPLYLELLKTLTPERFPYISATTIAKKLSLGDVQVRKDLASVCSAGRPRVGYITQELIRDLEHTLGYDQLTSAVLVGAGKLGRALLEYDEFKRFGVRIIAAFDSNERLIHLNGRVGIHPMRQFDQYCRENDVHLGIITVGEGSAQVVCDQMIAAGIGAIWNFAPCKLVVPEHVLLRNENLALSLAHLNKRMHKNQEDIHTVDNMMEEEAGGQSLGI